MARLQQSTLVRFANAADGDQLLVDDDGNGDSDQPSVDDDGLPPSRDDEDDQLFCAILVFGSLLAVFG
jgi:hypothetical protein